MLMILIISAASLTNFYVKINIFIYISFSNSSWTEVSHTLPFNIYLTRFPDVFHISKDNTTIRQHLLLQEEWKRNTFSVILCWHVELQIFLLTY